MLAFDINGITRVVEVPKQRRRKNGAQRPSILVAHYDSADRGVRGDLGVLVRVR